MDRVLRWAAALVVLPVAAYSVFDINGTDNLPFNRGVDDAQRLEQRRQTVRDAEQAEIRATLEMHRRLALESREKQHHRPAVSLAVLEVSADVNEAFNRWYLQYQPEHCRNWLSDEHMVTCANHKIQARERFVANAALRQP